MSSEGEPSEKPQFRILVSAVHISTEAVETISSHAQEAFPREAIGLLIGRELENEVWVTGSVQVTEGEVASVDFSEKDFSVYDHLKLKKDHIVGWYHSHPGHGLFMSSTDIKTHALSFQWRNPRSIALVVDSTKRKGPKEYEFGVYQVHNNPENPNQLTFGELLVFSYQEDSSNEEKKT